MRGHRIDILRMANISNPHAQFNMATTQPIQHSQGIDYLDSSHGYTQLTIGVEVSIAEGGSKNVNKPSVSTTEKIETQVIRMASNSQIQ